MAFVDKLFEQINYAAIEASSDYAKEKVLTDILKDRTGRAEPILKKRGYCSDEWKELREKSTQTGNEKRISFGDRADKFHFHYRGNDSGDRSGYEQVFPGREKRDLCFPELRLILARRRIGIT